MNPSESPPLPNEPAWRAYLLSALSLVPAFLSWVFVWLFLQARLEMVWQKAGLVGSRVQWLVSFSDLFRNNSWVIVIAAVLLFVFLELRIPSWPRYRRSVLFSGTVLLNAAVFAWILTVATAALLAAPLIKAR